jgi:hypothetical protein
MWCFLCQQFGRTEARCMLNLICGTSDENGHSEASCPTNHCMNCNRGHPSSDECCQVYMNERPVQGLSQDGPFLFIFLDEQVKFQESKPKTGNQFYLSVLYHPQRVNASTKTLAIPSGSSSSLQSTQPHLTVSSRWGRHTGSGFLSLSCTYFKDTSTSVTSAFSLYVYYRLQTFLGHSPQGVT